MNERRFVGDDEDVIVVSGTFKVDEAKREQALEVGERMAAASRAEDGCNAYAFWTDPREPSTFRVFEEWASSEALDAHFQAPHMATFLGELGGLGISASDISRYVVTEKSKLM